MKHFRLTLRLIIMDLHHCEWTKRVIRDEQAVRSRAAENWVIEAPDITLVLHEKYRSDRLWE